MSPRQNKRRGRHGRTPASQVASDCVVVLHQLQAGRTVGESCYIHNMAEKKAVLNVTVDESLAEQVREAAKFEHTTISSVVERAQRQQLAHLLRRIDRCRAIEEKG